MKLTETFEMRMKRFRVLPLRPEAFHFASEHRQGYSEEESKPHQNTLIQSLVGAPRPLPPARPRIQHIHNLSSSAHANKLMHKDSLSYYPTRRQSLKSEQCAQGRNLKTDTRPIQGKEKLVFSLSSFSTFFPSGPLHPT